MITSLARVAPKNAFSETRCQFDRLSRSTVGGAKLKVEVSCAHCGKPVLRYPSELRKSKIRRAYCNADCRNAHWVGETNPNFGHYWTNDQKAEMSAKKESHPAWNKGLTKEVSPSVAKYAEKLIGNRHGAATRGKCSPKLKAILDERNYHNNPSKCPEVRKKHSEFMKGRYTGSKNPNWNGGTSFGKYCEKFNNKLKESIRNAFGRKCFLCGKPESENHRRLDVHHVDYDRMQGCNGKSWLLVPLCVRCHGLTNNNRDYWNSTILERLPGA